MATSFCSIPSGNARFTLVAGRLQTHPRISFAIFHSSVRQLFVVLGGSSFRIAFRRTAVTPTFRVFQTPSLFKSILPVVSAITRIHPGAPTQITTLLLGTIFTMKASRLVRYQDHSESGCRRSQVSSSDRNRIKIPSR